MKLLELGLLKEKELEEGKEAINPKEINKTLKTIMLRIKEMESKIKKLEKVSLICALLTTFI